MFYAFAYDNIVWGLSDIKLLVSCVHLFVNRRAMIVSRTFVKGKFVLAREVKEYKKCVGAAFGKKKTKKTYQLADQENLIG